MKLATKISRACVARYPELDARQLDKVVRWAISEYARKLGGAGVGACKVRGDSDYYRRCRLGLKRGDALPAAVTTRHVPAAEIVGGAATA